MQEQVLNLNEKVIILGLDVESKDYKYEDITNNTAEPEILELFPPREQNNNADFDQQFKDFKLWCYPEGFQVYNEQCQQVNKQGQKLKKTDDLYFEDEEVKDLTDLNKLHNFIITDKKGVKRYCSCLIIYEKLQCLDNQGKVVKLYSPKSICLISLKNIFESNKQFLFFIYKNIYAPQMTKSAQNVKISSDLINEFKQILQQNNNDFQKSEQVWKIQYSQIKQKIYNQSSVTYALIRQNILAEFFISILFSNSQIFPSSCEYMQIVGPSLKDKESEIFRMYSKNDTYYCDNFSFKPLFSKLSVQNILILIQAILQEKQIILFSKDSNDTVSICEALLSLIQPLTYKCVYIPYLPFKLWETLQCMMPYIVGMNTKYQKFVQKNLDNQDLVIVNVDDNIIQCNDYIRIPQGLYDYFYQNITQVLKDGQNNKWNETVLNVKKISSNFFIGLLNNFLPFFTYSQNDCEEKDLVAKEIFDIENYVKIFPRENRDFIQELANNTMMFSQFLQDSYKILNKVEFQKKQFEKKMDPNRIYPFLKLVKQFQNDKQIDQFQVDYIDIKQKLSVIGKQQDLVISKTLQKYKSSFKIDVTEHVVKYLIYLEQIGQNPFDVQYHQVTDKFTKLSNLQQKNYLSQIIFKLDKKRFIPQQKSQQPQTQQQQYQQKLPVQQKYSIQKKDQGLNKNKNIQDSKVNEGLKQSYQYEIKSKQKQVKQNDINNHDFNALQSLLAQSNIKSASTLQQQQLQNSVIRQTEEVQYVEEQAIVEEVIGENFNNQFQLDSQGDFEMQNQEQQQTILCESNNNLLGQSHITELPQNNIEIQYQQAQELEEFSDSAFKYNELPQAVNRKINLDYDSYQNRKIINEFQITKENLKYEKLPELINTWYINNQEGNKNQNMSQKGLFQRKKKKMHDFNSIEEQQEENSYVDQQQFINSNNNSSSNNSNNNSKQNQCNNNMYLQQSFGAPILNEGKQEQVLQETPSLNKLQETNNKNNNGRQMNGRQFTFQDDYQSTQKKMESITGKMNNIFQNNKESQQELTQVAKNLSFVNNNNNVHKTRNQSKEINNNKSKNKIFQDKNIPQISNKSSDRCNANQLNFPIQQNTQVKSELPPQNNNYQNQNINNQIQNQQQFQKQDQEQNVNQGHQRKVSKSIFGNKNISKDNKQNQQNIYTQQQQQPQQIQQQQYQNNTLNYNNNTFLAQNQGQNNNTTNQSINVNNNNSSFIDNNSKGKENHKVNTVNNVNLSRNNSTLNNKSNDTNTIKRKHNHNIFDKQVKIKSPQLENQHQKSTLFTDSKGSNNSNHQNSINQSNFNNNNNIKVNYSTYAAKNNNSNNIQQQRNNYQYQNVQQTNNVISHKRNNSNRRIF